MKEKSNTITKIILDADSIVYNTAFALMNDTGNPNNEDSAILIADNLIAKQMAAVNKHFISKSSKKGENKYIRKEMEEQDDFKMYIGPKDSSTNFRFNIAKTAKYKGKRKQDKPPLYDFIREYLLVEQGAIAAKNMEADDAVGIQAKEWTDKGENVLVIANDKDLDQIPRVWRMWSDDKKNFPRRPYNTIHPTFSLERVNGEFQIFATSFWRLIDQILGGDSADSIPPLKKHQFGPVKRFQILQDIHSVLYTDIGINISSGKAQLDAEDIFNLIYNHIMNENCPPDIENDIKIFYEECDKWKVRILEQYRLVKILTYENELDKPLNEISVI
jgi:hypothetical protein